MRRAALLPLCLIALACQQSSHFVTRNELNNLLEVPPLPGIQQADGLGAEDRRQQIDLLVGETFTAPQASTRAAAAMLAANQRTAQLSAALNAIDLSFNVCATNLANLETTAFKASYAVRESGRAPVFRINFEQGSLSNTGRQLDLAIEGQGFFKVNVMDAGSGGFAYTRNGNFFSNRDGELVLGMGDGYKLEPGILVPKGVTDVSISQDGIVEVVKAGTKQRIGQIELSQFVNPEGLHSLAGSLYLQTALSGPPSPSKPGENGAGQLLQGFLESSNVDPNRERLRMRFLQKRRATILKVIDEMK